jgi:hypothetical protein
MLARPEVTGRKTRLNAEAQEKLPPAPGMLGAYSIAQFCRAHNISEAMYFKLKAQGLNPDEMEVGRRRTISIESAARWRVQREIAARESSEPKEENTEIA